MRARAAGAAVLLLLPAWLSSRDARAADATPTPAQCEAAYEGAQLLRQRGKLLAARDQADLCARDACPSVGRGDCARWSGEITHAIPSVVVVAREESGLEVAGLRLFVDGAARAELASGRAFEIDPGVHVFRVERPNGPPVEQSITIYQGERDRVLRITLPAAAPGPAPATSAASTPVASSASSAPSAATSPLPEGAAPQEQKGSALPAIVVGGVSLAVLATSAYLGITGRQELSDLRSPSGCAPACTDDQLNPVRTRLTVSDWALAVGLVGVATALSLFVLRGNF